MYVKLLWYYTCLTSLFCWVGIYCSGFLFCACVHFPTDDSSVMLALFVYSKCLYCFLHQEYHGWTVSVRFMELDIFLFVHFSEFLPQTVSLSLFLCLFSPLSVSVSVSLSLCLCLSLSLSVSLSVSLSLSLSVCLSVCLSLSLRLSPFQSVSVLCLFVCVCVLSVWMSVSCFDCHNTLCCKNTPASLHFSFFFKICFLAQKLEVKAYQGLFCQIWKKKKSKKNIFRFYSSGTCCEMTYCCERIT